MRLWTLHPKYLDARGLVALWREALLAQAVLRGKTTGYQHHPQLERFQGRRSPAGAIADYLRAIHAESEVRGYKFDAGRIGRTRALGRGRIPATRGQLDYEWDHLMAKLGRRDWARLEALKLVRRPEVHPLFRVVRGRVASWERPSRV